jgi:hypothetical protein
MQGGELRGAALLEGLHFGSGILPAGGLQFVQLPLNLLQSPRQLIDPRVIRARSQGPYCVHAQHQAQPYETKKH